MPLQFSLGDGPCLGSLQSNNTESVVYILLSYEHWCWAYPICISGECFLQLWKYCNNNFLSAMLLVMAPASGLWNTEYLHVNCDKIKEFQALISEETGQGPSSKKSKQNQQVMCYAKSLLVQFTLKMWDIRHNKAAARQKIYCTLALNTLWIRVHILMSRNWNSLNILVGLLGLLVGECVCLKNFLLTSFSQAHQGIISSRCISVYWRKYTIISHFITNTK